MTFGGGIHLVRSWIRVCPKLFSGSRIPTLHDLIAALAGEEVEAALREDGSGVAFADFVAIEFLELLRPTIRHLDPVGDAIPVRSPPLWPIRGVNRRREPGKH
jgi:hypothetical protein